MGKDSHYAKVSALIDKQFATADWEALQMMDRNCKSKAPSRPLRSR
jgi:hypothetical protein